MTRFASNLLNLAAGTLFVISAPAVLAAMPGLQVSISANTLKTVSEGSAFPITVRLKNVSAGPISIPATDDLSQQTYLSLITTDPAGNRVIFFPKVVDQSIAGALATQTRPLQPQEEAVLTVTLNESGAGAVVFKTSPTSIQPYSGEVNVKAVFSVDVDHQPLTTDPLLFIGSAASTDSESPLMITLVPKGSADLDADNAVTCKDLKIVRTAFGSKCGQTGFDTRADLDNSCTVDIRDLASVAQKLPSGTFCQ